MNITVFGGASPRPGEPAYNEAINLGKLLALSGDTVLTGGYSGTMEAVSRGASEAGGHVIGVTCEEIERWRPMGPNPWVQEEWREPTLSQRLLKLMDHCDAALALAGGAGTLAEISLLWNRMIIHAVPLRPLILIGTGWQHIFSSIFTQQGLYIPKNDQDMISFADNEVMAVNLLHSRK